MNFKKFISGVSALAIAASAFAGMAVTANAAVVTTTTYDFSTTSPAAPTTSRWSVNTAAVDPVDGTNTAALYSAASNSGNGYGAYVYYDLSSLIPADVISYTVSYKAYVPFETNSRFAVGLADINGYTFARYGYDTSPMIGSFGHFTDEKIVRATSGGNHTFINNWEGANHWITVTDTVNVANGTYTTSIAGDATYNNNGTIAEGKSYNTLLIYGYSTGGAERSLVYLDDITITTTAPDPGAATAIEIDYTSGGSTVASKTIDISAAGKLSGETSDKFYLPAYVTDASGNVYSTGLSTYTRTVSLVEGTTYVDVPVTAVSGLKSYFFEAEDNGGNTDESTNAGAYSMGKGKRRLDQKAVTITVPEDGVYTVKTGLVCKSSSNTSATITATSGDTSFTVTDTYYNAYRGSELSNVDVTLKAGNTLSFTTSDWNMGLDYVLLTKTADLPAGPTAEVEGISYQQFAAEDTDAKSDEDVTAAKVFVKTTGTVTRVGLSYNESAPQYAGDLTMTDATIVFGAIVPGRVDLQISNFTAVVE